MSKYFITKKKIKYIFEAEKKNLGLETLLVQLLHGARFILKLIKLC